MTDNYETQSSVIVDEDGNRWIYNPYNICRYCKSTYDVSKYKYINLCGCCYAKEYVKKNREKVRQRAKETNKRKRDERIENYYQELTIKLFEED